MTLDASAAVAIRVAEAARSYARALELATNAAERRFLERRPREVRRGASA